MSKLWHACDFMISILSYVHVVVYSSPVPSAGRPPFSQQHHYFAMFYMIAVNMWILFPFVECAPADRNPDCEMRSCIRVSVWLRARVIVCDVCVC